MKRSLLVTIDYEPMHGGIAAYWARVTKSLPIGQWRVLTSVMGPTDAAGQVIREPLLSRWFWPRWIKGIKTMYRVYKQERCELMVVAQLLPVGTMAYLLHCLFHIPYIVQVYGMDLAAASQRGRKRALARRILRSAQACIANSQSTAEMLKDFGVRADKVQVVYPLPEAPTPSTADVDRLRTLHQLTNKKVIVTVGRLVARKGHSFVIDSLPTVLKTVPNAVYVVVGAGPVEAELKRRATDLAVPVIFIGAVDKAERDAWFALADVFAMPVSTLPGDVEGFGMVYLEAGACSKPVIAGLSGGAVEAVIDGETGLIVTPSTETVAKALITLLTDTTMSKRLGHAGRMAFEQRWRWQDQMDVLTNMLV